MHLAHLGKLCQGFHGIWSSGMTFWLTAQLEFALEGFYGLDPQLEKTVLLLFRSRMILSRISDRMVFLRGATSDSFTMKGNVIHGMKLQFNKQIGNYYTRSHVNRWHQIQVAKITITSSHFAFCLLCVCVCVFQHQRNRLWLKKWS